MPGISWCCIPPVPPMPPRIIAMLRQHGHMPDCCGFCAGLSAIGSSGVCCIRTSSLLMARIDLLGASRRTFAREPVGSFRTARVRPQERGSALGISFVDGRGYHGGLLRARIARSAVGAFALCYFAALWIFVTVIWPSTRSASNLTLSPALTCLSIAGSCAKDHGHASSMSRFLIGPCLSVILPPTASILVTWPSTSRAWAKPAGAATGSRRDHSGQPHADRFMAVLLSRLLTSR